MRLLHAKEVHSCTFKNKGSLYRYTVGRFYNSGTTMVSAFMRPRFNATRFQVIDIPKVFTPSHELESYIASILQIEEKLSIRTPDGLYDGPDFHTEKSAELDLEHMMPGQQISQVSIDEINYSMVMFGNDQYSEVSFAEFAGCNDEGHQLWRVIPTPSAVMENKDVLDEAIGIADSYGSSFAIAEAVFH